MINKEFKSRTKHFLKRFIHIDIKYILVCFTAV